MTGKLAKIQRGARQGRDFDAPRRARFLELIRQGYSKNLAAPAAGVTRKTVADWLKSGRAELPRHPEHRRFAEEYSIAEAEGTMALYGKLIQLSETDTKAALALMRARGVPGFGPSKSQQQRANAAATRLAELEAELAAVRLANEREGKVEPTVLVIVERDLGGDG